MEIEHIAGVGFASRRTAHQQRDFTVGSGLLGEIVVDDQHVLAWVVLAGGLAILAVPHEVLAHGAAGHRREVEQGRGLRGGGAHHDGVAHGIVFLERLHYLGYGGALLADGDVDADDARVLLIDDRVHGHGGLAGLAVADDELALSAADGNQGVDGLEARLHGLVHASPLHDGRRDLLQRIVNRGLDRTLAIDGDSEWIHHAADEGGARGNGHDLACALDGVAFLDLRELAQQDDADVVLFQVEGQAHHVVGQLQQLARHRLLQAVGAGDAVTHADDGTDLGDVHLGVEAFDLATNDAGNFFRADVHAFLRTDGSSELMKKGQAERSWLFRSRSRPCSEAS